MNESETEDTVEQNVTITVDQSDKPVFEYGSPGKSDLVNYIDEITPEEQRHPLLCENGSAEPGQRQVELRFVEDTTTAEEIAEQARSTDVEEVFRRTDHDGDIDVNITVHPSAEELFNRFAEKAENRNDVIRLKSIIKETSSSDVVRDAYELGKPGLNGMLNLDRATDRIPLMHLLEMHNISEENWGHKTVKVEINYLEKSSGQTITLSSRTTE